MQRDVLLSDFHLDFALLILTSNKHDRYLVLPYAAK